MQANYTIAEKNLERQYLLAENLEPFTVKAFQKIGPLKEGAKILDIACGLGETTRLIASSFAGSHITGIDRDNSLIEAAKNIRDAAGGNINFVTGDAEHLPFADNSFDFVFSRYLLMHVPDPIAILKEMKRVCRPGGIVFAQEPDINSGNTYPESWAYDKLRAYFLALFVDGLVGRKLPGYFSLMEMNNLQSQADARFELYKNNRLRRLYTLTGEAIEAALLAKQLTTKEEYDDWIMELNRCENDETAVYLSHPVIAVWGTK